MQGGFLWFLPCRRPKPVNAFRYGGSYRSLAQCLSATQATCSPTRRKIWNVLNGSLPPFGAITVRLLSFTHEVLLILLKVVQSAFSPSAAIVGVYNGAAEYSLGSDDTNKWLTKGVKDVRSVLGYSGLSIPSQKNHLIILAGFETERAEKLVEFYEPTLLSIGHGDPLASIANSHFVLNRQFHRKLMDKYRDVRTFTFSCADPSETERAIEEQISKFPHFNIILAPLNTKISTAGAAMIAMKNPAIQLCYASVTTYNERAYSSPSQDCYIFQLPLVKSIDPA
jgi:hypothetical protein